MLSAPEDCAVIGKMNGVGGQCLSILSNHIRRVCRRRGWWFDNLAVRTISGGDGAGRRDRRSLSCYWRRPSVADLDTRGSSFTASRGEHDGHRQPDRRDYFYF